MTDKKVFQLKINSEIFLVRYPEKKDLKEMHKYINKLSREQTFVSYQGEEISLKEEASYLKDQLQRIRSGLSVQLLVTKDENIVGVSSVDMGSSTYSHEGVLGVSVLQEYRDRGIGKKLLDITLSQARKNLKNLRIISLTVFGNNKKAYDIYKKFGFQEYGRLPKGVFYKGEYFDRVYMYKSLQKS